MKLMKKRYLCLVFILIMAGLCGCRGEKKEISSASFVSGAAPEDGKGAAGENTAEVKNSGFPEEDIEEVSELPLYTCEAFELALITYHEFESGKNMLALDLIPYIEDSFFVSLENILINDKVRLQDNVSVFCGGEEEIVELRELTETLALSGMTLSKLKLSLYYGGLSEPENVEAEVPKGFTPGLLCVPFMGARAERQTIIDDGFCRAELICCGLIRGYNESYLSGIIQIENFSEESIPADINGILVNGHSLIPISDKGWVSPGEKAYVFFREYGNSIKEAGISAISSVSIQLLTDREDITENTGFTSGGQWYELELSEAAVSEDEAAEEGEMVYEDDELKIFYLGKEERMSSLDKSENRYIWKLEVVYTGEETVELGAENICIDGIALKDAESTAICLLDKSQAAPNSRLKTQLILLSFAKEQPSEVKFDLYVYRQGKAKLLRISDESIILK